MVVCDCDGNRKWNQEITLLFVELSDKFVSALFFYLFNEFWQEFIAVKSVQQDEVPRV